MCAETRCSRRGTSPTSRRASPKGSRRSGAARRRRDHGSRCRRPAGASTRSAAAAAERPRRSRPRCARSGSWFIAATPSRERREGSICSTRWARGRGSSSTWGSRRSRSPRAGRTRIARDFERLPVTRPLGDRGDPRDPFRGFVADALPMAMRNFGEADAVVLALPAELDDAGCPEGSSYPGLQGDHDLAACVLARAGIPGARVALLNDAELAAVSAKRVVAARSTALVLTVGFGIGGALLLPRWRASRLRSSRSRGWPSRRSRARRRPRVGA